MKLTGTVQQWVEGLTPALPFPATQAGKKS